MNRLLGVGVGATAAGILGYAVGVFVAYPGRAFALTVLMVGVSLVAMGRSAAGAEA